MIEVKRQGRVECVGIRVTAEIETPLAWVIKPVLALPFVFIPASQPGGIPLNEVHIITTAVVGVGVVSVPASQSGGIDVYHL